MELDWYSNKVSVDAVLTPTSSFSWRSSSPNGAADPERQSSRWLSLLNLMQEKGLLTRSPSGDDYSPPGSALSSPQKRRGAVCSRSLSGERCSRGGDSPLPSPSKSHHVCFGCVFHSPS